MGRWKPCGGLFLGRHGHSSFHAATDSTRPSPMLDLGKDAGIESGIKRRCLTIVSTDPRLARSRLFIFPGVRPDWRPRSPLSCGLKSASTFPGGGRERRIDYRGRAPRSAHAGNAGAANCGQTARSLSIVSTETGSPTRWRSNGVRPGSATQFVEGGIEGWIGAGLRRAIAFSSDVVQRMDNARASGDRSHRQSVVDPPVSSKA
jgi:hypothetical protein